MIITEKCLLRLTRQQHIFLNDNLHLQKDLYNGCLEDRINDYKRLINLHGPYRLWTPEMKKKIKFRSLYDQTRDIKNIRVICPEYQNLPVNLLRGTMKRLDRAYKGFLSRIGDKTKKAGFPRFKSYLDSFEFAEFSGITLEVDKTKGRIRFKGLPGSIRINHHRSLPKDIKSCIFKKKNNRWWLYLTHDKPDAYHVPSNEVIGLDMGINQLVMTSQGQSVDNLKLTKRFGQRIKRANQTLARAQRGSNRRKKTKLRLAKLSEKLANTRKTYLHQVSRKIVNQYDNISVEDLKIKNMVKSQLAKSIHDASWGQLKQYIVYKAVSAGKQVIEVDPKYTSQMCSGCGVLVKKPLSQRIHSCLCGLVMDRDHNAAINIAAKAVGGLAGYRVLI